MGNDNIIRIYWKYKNYVDKLAECDVCTNPTVNEIFPGKDDKSKMQGLYIEIKKMNFKGTLIDFLCFIYTVSVVESVIEFKNKLHLIELPVDEALLNFLHRNIKAIKNMIRLAGNRPDLFKEALRRNLVAEEVQRVTNFYAMEFMKIRMQSA